MITLEKIKNAILDLIQDENYIPLSPNEMLAFFNDGGFDFGDGDFWRTVQEMEGEDFSIAFLCILKKVIPLWQ